MWKDDGTTVFSGGCDKQAGSIEGRVGVHHLDDAQQSKNFTFKCQRDGNEIYSVNSLNFHPVSFCNVVAFYFPYYSDFQVMSRGSQPIPCRTFNNDGLIFAYSSCYDWSRGAENHNPATAKTYLFLQLPQRPKFQSIIPIENPIKITSYLFKYNLQ
ncbi:hypothetical protein Dsin_032210 [Dipteronia sinensis]|uniref:Uncharacterized protein n=1 Tax=Dipteronia sinensis TaxID=43782 RepID=A0AAE0DT21_9ROSI|nr:hypothetical protein Dsin_032210 [Dipteronia sinensis]